MAYAKHPLSLAVRTDRTRIAQARALAAVLPPFFRTIGGIGAGAELGGDADRRYYPDPFAPDTPPQVEAVVLDLGDVTGGDRTGEIRRIRLRIHRHGALFAFVDATTSPPADVIDLLSPLGFRFFRGWAIGLLGETAPFESHDPDEVPCGLLLLRFQRATYEPVTRARDLLRESRFGDAMSVLNEVPEGWYETDEKRGLLDAERLICLLAHDRVAGPAFRHLHLVSALHAFNRACTLAPNYAPSYLCMAALWRSVGRGDMGQRMLRTLRTTIPSAAVEESLSKSEYTFPATTAPVYPRYDPDFPLRILIICHPESDFGSDVLHDGLRRVLGAENVAEYPWKPTLHGQDLDKAYGYPCTFFWPEAAIPLEDLVHALKEGAFDAILYSDTIGTLPKNEIRHLLDAAGSTPIFLLDMWDECGNLQDMIRERDGLPNVAGYFKRERVAGLDYGPCAWPLLFAYPDDRFAGDPMACTREGVFWAGKLIGGARRLQLTWLSEQVAITGAVGTQFSQEEYVELLRRQSVGLCFFGNGFDTVRYWELPAHGVMMLSERSPLVIPHDFEDGKHAVFFEHADELLEKTRYYAARPDEAAEIARAGHAHAREFHTGSARARQCLGVIQARLRERASTPP